MIDHQFVRMMARYNRWQNRAAYAAAATLDDAARRQARGAFFGSIHRTCAHLLWADRIWLSRFDQCAPPGIALSDSGDFVGDWDDLVAQRRAMDATILAWADGFAEGPVAGTLNWYSGVMGRDVTAPLAVVIPHIFNHQTHHRGQIHAMLTAAGAKTQDSDLFLMPVDEWAGAAPA